MTTYSAPIFVIAPDSFKGSLSAEQVAQAIGRGLKNAIPNAEIRLCPLADGGEGTLEVLLHAGGEKHCISVRGASGALRQSATGRLPDGSAVIESAEIVGITDETGMCIPVEQRSTLGVGDAICTLLDQGCRRFLIGLGGSSTNDGGVGMLTALGVKFLDDKNCEVMPVPAALPRIVNIDISGLDPRLKDTQIIVMSDVNNPLCGPKGATAVFGPQKGVTPTQIPVIDQSLAHVAQLLEKAFDQQIALKPGAGAAGGLGFALLILGAQFQSGAETVIERIGLDAALDGAHWLITGEGRSDHQTLHGKGPFIACQHAKQRQIPTSLLSGGIDITALDALQTHFNGCFSITFGPTSLADAIADAEALLYHSAQQMAQLWRTNHNKS
jgi:glycerate kinase